MNQEKHNYLVLWEKTSQHTARLLRLFGYYPIVTVPEQINGFTVTEIGNYCFAKDCQLPKRYFTTELNSVATQPNCDKPTELYDNYIESIDLPDSLQKIGNYAFYNCRNLSHIMFGKELHMIGSDAFMNCHQLHQLTIKCTPKEKTGLRQILEQIPWNIRVSFCIRETPDNIHKEATIFFPEYSETYDEIAPAHIFGRTIIGEGFRARQCFQDGVIDFTRYDAVFKKACFEESILTLCHFAFCRLYCPYKLSETSKTIYENYILTHGKIFCQSLIENKQLKPLSFLYKEKLLSSQNVEYAIILAAQIGWSEGSASMLRWKQQYYNMKQNRFDFDVF